MRLIRAGSLIYLLTVAFGLWASGSGRADDFRRDYGQTIFRYDTFGDEQLWTDVLRMHEVIQNIDPATALAVGLKVDVDALPPTMTAALRKGAGDLADPAVTTELLRVNAVVGVKGSVNESGQLTAIGVTCALATRLSTIHLHRASGNGSMDGRTGLERRRHRGALTGVGRGDESRIQVLGTWQVRSAASRVRRHQYHSAQQPIATRAHPANLRIEGRRIRDLHCRWSDFHWNSYVGVSQMGGHGSFSDPRIGLSIQQSPISSRRSLPRCSTINCGCEHPSRRREVSISRGGEGKEVFRNEARCSTCHQGSTFTDVLSGPDQNVPLLHDAADVGVEPVYASRSATGAFRTTPLRALLVHAPYFHDGSAPDLPAVVNHYDRLFDLKLTPAQKADLVEYVKSL